MLKRLWSFVRVSFSRRGFEESMSEELRFHIEQYAADLTRSGVPADEALRRARIEFGAMNSVKEECRESRRLHLVDELQRESRYAARQLQKTPAFTVAALVTIALCLGANLAIFSVIDSVLLQPLPFPDAERLVTIFNTYPKAGVERDGSSITNYYERRGRIQAFSSLSIYRYVTAIAGEPGSAVREQAVLISPDFFTTLGRGPVRGRAFTEQETAASGPNRVVILTDAYWRQHFSADPGVIGRHIQVEGATVTVVGVLPREFRFLSSKARLYFPMVSRPQDRSPLERHSGGNVIQMIARLKPNSTVAQAQGQVDAQNAALEKDDPKGKMMADAGFRSIVALLHADEVAAVRPVLLLLEAGALILLLIGTVNLTNLFLVRASARATELTIRRALGASRRYIFSEALAETGLLCVMGGLLGLAVGAVGIRLLAALGSDRLPFGAYIAFDRRVVGVALITTVFMTIALAAPVAWFHLRRHLYLSLQSEGRGGTSNRAAQSLRHSFIVAQVGLGFVLLAGAGLLGLSLKQAVSISPGFRPDHVLTGQVSLPRNQYPNSAARQKFIHKLIAELSGEPGVSAAGIVNNVPFSGKSGKSSATVKGRVLRPGEAPRGHYSYGVAGDYFRAMGFSLIAGRFLTESDLREMRRVCVVDEDFARHYWPNGGAIGQRLFEGSRARSDDEAFTVVGVVGSAKQAGLTEDAAQGAIYYPYVFRGDDNIFFAVRSSVRPESLAIAVRNAIRRIDPGLPVSGVQSMDERIADSLTTRRSPALLAALFSGVALLLIGVGIYGVLSYAVAQRRREIGVRIAVGARPDQIWRHFFFLAVRLFAAGAVFGIFGAWLAGRAMRAVLFHVTALNIPVLAGTLLIIAAASVAACLVPAYRAARTSPVEALAEQ
jgi:predicted permease